MLKALWAEWSQAQGLNDEDFDVDSADDEAVQELLDKYTGVKHIKDRYNKLLDSTSRVKNVFLYRLLTYCFDRYGRVKRHETVARSGWFR